METVRSEAVHLESVAVGDPGPAEAPVRAEPGSSVLVEPFIDISDPIIEQVRFIDSVNFNNTETSYLDVRKGRPDERTKLSWWYCGSQTLGIRAESPKSKALIPLANIKYIRYQ